LNRRPLPWRIGVWPVFYKKTDALQTVNGTENILACSLWGHRAVVLYQILLFAA
jgi:hypothetical protein